MFVLETRIITHIAIIIISHKSLCAQTRQPGLNPECKTAKVGPSISHMRLITALDPSHKTHYIPTYTILRKTFLQLLDQIYSFFFFHIYPLKDSLIHWCPLLSVGFKSIVVFFFSLCVIYIYLYLYTKYKTDPLTP